MTLSLLTNPGKTRFSTLKCRAVASKTQVPYEFRKADDTFTDILQGSSSRIALNGVTIGLYTVSEFVGFATNDGTVFGYGQIDNIGATSIRINTWYIDGAQSKAGTIFRPGDYTDLVVEVNVLNSGGIAAINETPLTFSLDPSGRLLIDIKDVVEAWIKKNKTTWALFSIEWRQRHSTSTPAFTSNEDILAISASKQLQDYAGATLWDTMLKVSINDKYPFTSINDDAGFPGNIEIQVGASEVANYAAQDMIYVRSVDGKYDLRQKVLQVKSASIRCEGPFTSNAGSGINYIWGGRYLSAFSSFRPMERFKNNAKKYWDGWLQNMYVFVDPDCATRLTAAISFYFRYQNINKIAIGNTQTNGIDRTIPTIVSQQIPSIADLAATGLGAKYLLTYCRIGTDHVCERLYMPVEDCEPQRPIMMEWKNNLGGFDYWLFGYSQEIRLNESRTNKWEVPIDSDFEVAKGFMRQETEDIQQVVVLTADDLTLDQVQGLKTINYSDEIYLYLRKDGSKKVRVIIDDGWSVEVNTKEHIFSMSFNVIMPMNFDLIKAIEYEFQPIWQLE